MATHETPPLTESPLRLRVAAEVRAWRARRNMTQVQLARALGISQPQVSARLRGDTPITLDEIDALASVFGTTADAILTGAQANENGPQRANAEAPRRGGELNPAGALTREDVGAEFRCTPPSWQPTRRRRVHRRTPDIAPIVPLRCVA